MRHYFFLFDTDGSVANWQIAETDAGADRLRAAGYTEVTPARYRQLWQARDSAACAALYPLHERTV